MKLGLTNVDGGFYKVIDVDKIEQVIKLMKRYKHSIVLEKNPFYNQDFSDSDIPREYRDCKYTIEIYDDYRE